MTKPTILIIVGITGNLSRHKLLPAIERLGKTGVLPKQFSLVGISRRNVNEDNIIKGLGGKPADHAFIRASLQMVQMDLKNLDDYHELKKRLADIEKTFGKKAQRLFYLSIPPQFSEGIIEQLGEAGLNGIKDTKLLLEKPFGSDLASARQLVKNIRRDFKENQVYRIDHYLAKDMAMNLLSFRSDNPLFGRSWNKDFIERIEIVAAEKIDIEGRVDFYEQVGALGDFVQSHALELAALTLMDAPDSGSRDDIPKLRLKALKLLHIPDKQLAKYVKRAQYNGYPEDVKNPTTKKETFVSITLFSDDPRWKDVPIILTTGKALDRKHTEIRLYYRPKEAKKANELILRVQPKEGLRLGLWSKKPTYRHELEQVELEFHYNERSDTPQPYEQVFLSAIQGDRVLFTTHQEVLESWRILAPVQQLWSKGDKDLVRYERGKWPKFT